MMMKKKLLKVAIWLDVMGQHVFHLACSPVCVLPDGMLKYKRMYPDRV
jgi:hypothetical protein